MEYSISPLEIPRNICGLHRAVHITGKPYTSPKGKAPGPDVVHVYYRPHPYQLIPHLRNASIRHFGGFLFQKSGGNSAFRSIASART